jgi:DNA-directed RNA polymerase subunit RPC12/RpoP
MSTTDRFTIYESPCSCGKGKYVVDECSPDHPYVRPSQTWWETYISCPECREKYLLEKRNDQIVRIRKEANDDSTELEVIYQIKSSYYRRL